MLFTGIDLQREPLSVNDPCLLVILVPKSVGRTLKNKSKRARNKHLQADFGDAGKLQLGPAKLEIYNGFTKASAIAFLVMVCVELDIEVSHSVRIRSSLIYVASPNTYSSNIIFKESSNIIFNIFQNIWNIAAYKNGIPENTHSCFVDGAKPRGDQHPTQFPPLTFPRRFKHQRDVEKGKRVTRGK